MRIRVQVKRSKGVGFYGVAADTAKDTAWCECPAWKFQKVPPAVRQCKHTAPLLREAKNAEYTGSMVILVAMYGDFEVGNFQPARLERAMVEVERRYKRAVQITVADVARFGVLDFEVAPVQVPKADGRSVDFD